jgi:type IV pilus assembly protein PilV
MDGLPLIHSRGVRKPSKSRGVSLIEVMVSLVILTVGLLGVGAMQLKALRNNMSAGERSMAVIQVYSIIDAMRTNLTVARSGGYAYANSAACEAPAGTSRADKDLSRWLSAIHEDLGGSACGNIDCLNGKCTIRVYWNDSRGTGGSAGQYVQIGVVL